MDPVSKREIEEAVGAQLRHYSLTGTVVLEGKQLELRSKGIPVSIEVGSVGDQWPLLPPEMRVRRINDVSRRLADAYRSATGGSASMASGGSPASTRSVGAVVALVVVFAGVWAGVRWYVKGLTKPTVAASTPRESKEQESERLARVCEAMRKRMYDGASFAAFDAGGWVVELWLASRDGKNPGDSPAFKTFIAGDKLGPQAGLALARITDGSVSVTPGFAGDAAKRSPNWHGATLMLSGGYARAFFDADQRSLFVSLADKLADGSGAELGAMYGRCAHLTSRDVGSWFRGKDAPTATASLLYTMGMFADPPSPIDKSALGAFAKSDDLDAFRTAAAKVDASALSGMIAGLGGSVTSATAGGSGVGVTFPIGGPARAMSATRVVARRIGVGVGSD